MIGLLIYLFSIVSIYWFWVRNGWLIVWLLIDVIKYDFLTCDSFHERKLGVSMQDLKAYITGIWSFPSIIDFYYESRFSCRFPFWIINHKDLLTLTSNQDFPKILFFRTEKRRKRRYATPLTWTHDLSVHCPMPYPLGHGGFTYLGECFRPTM